MSAAREKIFADIRAALDPLPHLTPRPEVPHGVADAQWLEAEEENVTLFTKRARAVGTLCFFSLGECIEVLRDQKVQRMYVPAELAELKSGLAAVFDVTHDYRREDVDVVDVAFTPAAGGIAESGTIILTDQSTPDRLAALAPWTHVAVLRKSTIHRSIADALAAMPDDPNVVWVTGPSKTADVEGILIQGVHGPGVQACLLV
jgi:L-lactate dehydrogenase complex protein LldG